ncbi:MAG: hypothetical protein KDH48_26655 [Rhodoferax sp.]|nr:hypothetical protein [Rhodoferax sp.]
MKKSKLFFVSALMFMAHAIQAQVIDFETVPGGVPADKLAITDQYRASFGVTFSLSNSGTPNGTTPFLEATGQSDTGHAFINRGRGLYDTADAGFEQQLGNFFLRIGTATGVRGIPPSLVIRYDTPVFAASAEIWDLDESERWRIDAIDEHDAVVASILSPVGLTWTNAASLDGKPWVWSFDRTQADIHAISITYVGASPSGDGVGIAFNNFSPATAVPEPRYWALFGIGLLVVFGSARQCSHGARVGVKPSGSPLCP